jgi:hypothetical protein
MAVCRVFSNFYTKTTTDPDEEYIIYWLADETIEECGNITDGYVILTPTEYATLEHSGYLTFDEEAYDMAYSGVVGSWVIGLGIGFVLAMIAKLKR